MDRTSQKVDERALSLLKSFLKQRSENYRESSSPVTSQVLVQDFYPICGTISLKGLILIKNTKKENLC